MRLNFKLGYNLVMNLEIIKKDLVYPSETYSRCEGTCRHSLADGTELVSLSANTWEAYLDLLGRDIVATDRVVASPELITYNGGRFEDLKVNRYEIEDRITMVVDRSTNYPNTTFLLGTPLFVDENKPRNSVILIKNGEIVGATSKRCGATPEENKYFEMVAEEAPMVIPGTNTSLLICSDLAIAGFLLEYEPEKVETVLRVAGKENLIGKRVRVVDGLSTSAIVVSCWGVGAKFLKEEKYVDEYYKNQLVASAWRLMRNTRVKEVVVVDRVPLNMPVEVQKLPPKSPYNGVIRLG